VVTYAALNELPVAQIIKTKNQEADLTTKDVPLAHRTIRHVLESAVAERPDFIALQDPTQKLSYGETWTKALQLTAGYGKLGLKRQEIALIMFDNHVDSVLAWLGLSLGGYVEATINTAYKGDMLAHIVNSSTATTILTEDRYLPRLMDIRPQIPALKTVVIRASGQLSDDQAAAFRQQAAQVWDTLDFTALAAHAPASPETINPWDLISISFTSGTSGRSKGVLCPHAHAFGHATTVGLCKTNPGEVRYIVLPQFHIAGRWGGVYNSLASHACAYIAPTFSASKYWEQVRATGATTSQLVGSMAEFLLRQPPSPLDRDHNLREISVIPVPADIQIWKDRFGVDLAACYGSTELGSILATTPATIPRSVGRVREGYEVRIVDENDMELPAGEVGELIMRPKLPWTSSVGYLNDPQRTGDVWRNGWLHSGDALYCDENGNYFFVDRVDDAIRRRGENISSSEVELYMCQHPAVAEAAAVAVPSEHVEDEIKVVVVLKDGCTVSELELAEFMADTVPYFMVPRYIEITKELPRTPTAKVKKNELRAQGVKNAWDAEAAGFNPKHR
jgi:crotonobetaine/carnitine-CoA ligase